MGPAHATQSKELMATLKEYDAQVSHPDRYHHAWVLLQLGKMQKKDGNLEGAREAYQKLNKLYPRSREAREGRAELRSLKK